MISHIFISFSAAQIYDLPYILLHPSILWVYTTVLQTHKVTSSQMAWLNDSSVGRALHRYHRGHGFKSRSGLSCVCNCNNQSYIQDISFSAVQIYSVWSFIYSFAKDLCIKVDFQLTNEEGELLLTFASLLLPNFLILN